MVRGLEEERERVLAWFAALSVPERQQALCIQEPAFVRLLELMARKANHGRTRVAAHGRRPPPPSLARFIVFTEGVPALGAGFGGDGGRARAGRSR